MVGDEHPLTISVPQLLRFGSDDVFKIGRKTGDTDIMALFDTFFLKHFLELFGTLWPFLTLFASFGTFWTLLENT